MTSDLVLGQAAFFRLIDDQLPTNFSPREARLLVGSLNFHALMAPDAELVVHGYGGAWSDLPRTTDDSTFTGLSRAFRSREFSIRTRSTVAVESRDHLPAEARSLALVSRSSRHIHISRDAVLGFDPPRDMSPDPVRRVLRAVRSRMPLLYDQARDLELLRHRRALVTRARRRDYENEFAPGGEHEESAITPASAPRPDAPRAVLFGLHWLEIGGAERWAFESIRIAREAGLLPIVLTNRDSHQAWAMRPELDGAIVITFSEATVDSQTAGVEELLRAILRLFDVRAVCVHHNQWLYDRLHWIALSRPDVPIIDSTHIVEYRGGGYPLSSALVDDVITHHHVISPTLEDWMVRMQEIDKAKIVMAPLGGLTVDPQHARFRPRDVNDVFTVAFIGRMARQKAPEVFVAMAARVHARHPDVRFVMHGDGEMASWVDDLIKTAGLQDVIVRCSSATVVAETLDRAHVLVVPSHNEGLTLTTLEAIALGVPVVSTDVGAQSDIIPDRALVSRNAYLAVRGLAEKVSRLVTDEAARNALWRDERSAEKTLLSQASASEWFTGEVRSW